MTILGSMFLANGCRVFVYLLYLSVFSYLSLCLFWQINLFIKTAQLGHHVSMGSESVVHIFSRSNYMIVIIRKQIIVKSTFLYEKMLNNSST